MRVEYHLSKEEKVEKFGEGIWTDEPDEAEWIHEESGLPCLVLRSSLGSLCGYVGVPPAHPWHAVQRPDCDANITFAGLCVPEGIAATRSRPGSEAFLIEAHLEPAFLGYWVLGFDYGHASRDVVPAFRGKELSEILPSLSKGPLLIASRFGRGALLGPQTYCDFTYVREQVEHLAQQAHEVFRGKKEEPPWRPTF